MQVVKSSKNNANLYANFQILSSRSLNLYRRQYSPQISIVSKVNFGSQPFIIVGYYDIFENFTLKPGLDTRKPVHVLIHKYVHQINKFKMKQWTPQPTNVKKMKFN